MSRKLVTLKLDVESVKHIERALLFDADHSYAAAREAGYAVLTQVTRQLEQQVDLYPQQKETE